MGIQNSGGISNPGLAFVQIHYASYLYNGKYNDANINSSYEEPGPFYIKQYNISTKS
jgi:hypothetical protein